MKISRAATLAMVVASALPVWAQSSPQPQRPKAGPTAIMRSVDLRPGMKGTAWTVLQGKVPEPIPVEILGLWKNAWGPKQDIILAKMGGKAIRTNVAGGMSGSPVYVDGKLIGAVALRLSQFSPDAICGITPIELMLEIKDYDGTLPADARTPEKARNTASLTVPGEMLARVVSAGGSAELPQTALMTPIETPLAFSGFEPAALEEFGPLFRELGFTAVQGGASSTLDSPKPGPGWQHALQPGDAVAGVLISGDMSVTGLGSVTYNDGHHILAFGHPFFNLGPVDMPMSAGEIVFTNASAFQPNKFGNATEIVGALHQDRHSGIMGTLGDTAEMVPVSLRVRSFAEDNNVRKQREFHFNVFVQQKWTPYLMMITLFNSISGLNDFMEEATYRVSGKIELAGEQRISFSTMQAAGGEMSIPAPMILAGWWGDKFLRLFGNAVQTPQLKSVDATVDLLPERRVATIENAWIPTSEVTPGEKVPIKVFLRPYRGPQIEKVFDLTIPATLAKGDHRILLSDAETLNHIQNAAAYMNRFIDVPQIVSLINHERSNDKLYVSLIESRPTVYYDDKTLPSLPASVLNVMQTGRAASRPYATSGETAFQEAAIPFDYVVNGSYALKVTVK